MFYEKFYGFSLGSGLRISVEDFGWVLVGECPRSVSGWCVWTRSRPGPDGELSVMQFTEGLCLGHSSLVHVILWASI